MTQESYHFRAMLHDPIIYPDPLAFSPERFLDQARNEDLGINEFPWQAFGFGRRFVTQFFSPFIITIHFVQEMSWTLAGVRLRLDLYSKHPIRILD